ncbi:MAG: CopG family transcriptional regulator [Spirochaetaceae bacterium]|nr:CopG family transcriptional regulator [Spirochaetaceae bacterium]
MKTVTVRLDDDTYRLIRQAAGGELRSISNFIEYATLSYLTDAASVSDQEMAEILSDADLVSTLRHARSEVSGKKYRIVE